MRTNKVDDSCFQALAALICCVTLITQSERLFAQDNQDPGQTPAATAEEKDSNEKSDTKDTKETPAETDKQEEGLPPLAEMITIALENNPDIGVAVSQVREAEAELKRTRLTVVQQVMELEKKWSVQQQLIANARANVENAQKQEEYYKSLDKIGHDVRVQVAAAKINGKAAEVALVQAEAELATLQAKVLYLLGRQPIITPDKASVSKTRLDARSFHVTAPDSPNENKEKPQAIKLNLDQKSAPLANLHAALGDTTELDFKKTSLDEVVKYISELHGIPIQINKNAFQTYKDQYPSGKDFPEITFKISNVSLGAALQAITDLNPQVKFIVRDYGLLVTNVNVAPSGIEVNTFMQTYDPAQPNRGFFHGAGAF